MDAPAMSQPLNASERLMLLFAMEWGFKAAESGWNYDMAIVKFRELMDMRPLVRQVIK